MHLRPSERGTCCCKCQLAFCCLGCSQVLVDCQTAVMCCRTLHSKRIMVVICCCAEQPMWLLGLTLLLATPARYATSCQGRPLVASDAAHDVPQVPVILLAFFPDNLRRLTCNALATRRSNQQHHPPSEDMQSHPRLICVACRACGTGPGRSDCSVGPRSHPAGAHLQTHVKLCVLTAKLPCAQTEYIFSIEPSFVRAQIHRARL